MKEDKLMGRFDSIQQLNDAEKILATMFRSITIISELKISYSDYKFLRKQIKTRLELLNVQEREIRNIWYEYPYTCLTVTVFTAIYYYDGNFWEHFQQVTSCKDVNSWKIYMWQTFKRKEITLFNEEGTQKFVSTILGHAGVPKKSMEGFVKGLLIPAVTSGLDAEEVLSDIRENETPGQLYLLHKGVRDYLSSGGNVAVDFVDRCLHVLKNPEKPFKETYKGILPLRVLNGLEEVVSRVESGLLHKRDKIRPPALCLDPIEGVIFFQLPILSFSSKVQEINWEISEGISSKKVLACNIVTRNNQWEALPKNDYIVANPDTNYTLSLLVNDGIYKQWSFNTHGPIIFSANDGTFINRYHTYAGVYWMVAKDDLSFIHSKDHGIIYDRLSASWIQHRLIEVTPGKSDTVKFISKTKEYLVPIQLKREKPYLLEEGEKLWGGSLSCYSSPPTICFPKSQLQARKMSDWIIKVKSGNEKPFSVSIISLKSKLKDYGEYYRLSLKDLPSELLPGHQEVHIIGPLGMGARLSFMMLPPSLSVISQIDYDSTKRGISYRDSTYQLKIDPTYSLECVTGLCKFNQIKPGVYRLFVPSKVAEIQLNVLKQGVENLSLLLVAKKITWDIAIDNEVKATNFNHSVHEDECLNCTISLRANFNHHKWTNVKIELIDEKGLLKFYINRKISSSTPIPVNLSSFYDTIKHSNGNRLTLLASFPQNSDEISPVPLLTVEKVWEISDVKVQEISDSLKVTWKEKPLLSGRIIRIWNEEKPWSPYEEISIPDGSSSLEILWGKRTGSYLFEWAQKMNGDIFGFFDDIVYPQKSSRTFLYETKESLERIPDFNKYVATSYSHYFHGNQLQCLSDKDNLLNGNPEFLYKLDQEELLNFIVSLKLTESEEGLVNGIINLYEWDWEYIMSIPYLKRRINLPITNFSSKDFGTVQGDLSPFFNKSFNKLKGLLHMIPFEKGIINDFSVTHQIIQLVMKTKRSENYKNQIENICNNYLLKIKRIFYRFWEKGMVPDTIKDMIDLRWSRTQKPSYNNLPYLISLVAFLNRLLIRERKKFSSTDLNCIRKVTQEFCRIEDLWLFHDAYVFENILNERLQKKGVETIGHSSDSWN
jgi:hypothetical protein